VTPEQARAAEAIAHTQAVYATEGDTHLCGWARTGKAEGHGKQT
jgi:hypothetical protein